MQLIKNQKSCLACNFDFILTLGILLTFTELGVGGGGVTGLKEISSSGQTSGFSENMHSRSIYKKQIIFRTQL